MTATAASVTCACPRRDAKDCVHHRLGYDMRAAFGEDLTEDQEDERCECVCHDGDPDDDDTTEPDKDTV